MKSLLFVLPLTASQWVWDGGKTTKFWETANKLWCSSGGSNFAYSEANTKLCCSKYTENVVFTADGYCTGKEDFQNGPIYKPFDQCCWDLRAFTAAHTINGITPSKIIMVNGMDVPVNSTTSTQTDESIPTGYKPLPGPEPSSVTTVPPKVANNGITTISNNKDTTAPADSTTTASDSKGRAFTSLSESTANPSTEYPNSKPTPTGRALDSVAGSTNTSSSRILTPSSFFAIIMTLIAIGN